MSSLCCFAPSKKNELSWVSAGRGRSGRGAGASAAAGAAPVAPLAAVPVPGLKRRIRNSIVATSSPSWSRYSVRLVTKWPMPEPGLLLPRDRVDHRRHLEPVPGHQRTLVVLVAVGGHDRGEPGPVQEGRDLVVGRARRLPAGAAGGVFVQAGPQPPHDPGLQHGRRCDHAREPGGPGGVGVDVDRVEVPHRLHPVLDHGLVDGLGPTGGRSRDLADEGLQLVVQRRRPAHRAPRFMPRPAVARISRWISLTPPPNVLIWAWRPARSSSPWSAAPGEPGLR